MNGPEATIGGNIDPDPPDDKNCRVTLLGFVKVSGHNGRS